MKIKTILMATLVSTALLASPTLSQAKTTAIDTNQIVTSSAKTYHTISMYNHAKVAVEFVNVSKITKDKKIQQAIKRDIKGVVKEAYTDQVRKGAKISATYKVHAYKKGIVSISAYFTENYKGQHRFITEANFNYKKNDTRSFITPYRIEDVGNMTAITKHLKNANKAKWGVSIGMPQSRPYPYVFNEKRDLIVQYDASDINKTKDTGYETIVPRKVVFN